MHPRLSGNQKVQIKRTPPHIGEDFYGARRHPLAIHTRRRPLTLLILGQNSAEQIRIARANFPVRAEVLEGRDEQIDGGVDAVVDGGAVDEEDARGDPEAECEGGSETG